MPLCPRCQSELATIRHREGLFYRCPNCFGRAVTLPQIRRVAGDKFATGLMREINRNTRLGERSCPFCSRRMRIFSAPAPPLELDACKPCGAVWFDPQEFEAVPEGAVESEHELRLRGAEAFGRHRIEQSQPAGSIDQAPDELWQAVPAFFGFPVETDADALVRRPWLTWGLALIIATLSIMAFTELEAAVKLFGFVPATPWRLGGLTWISSFFLHADVWHLIGNLYFFLIFADNVEDVLGRGRFLLLLIAASLAGDAVHWLTQLSSTIPCVGASGGISGVIVFYALRFPQAKLGFMMRVFVYFRWLQIPAWFALVLWIMLQFFDATMELSGYGNVAATAHLGGAAAGFVAWYCWRKRDARTA